MHEDWKEIEGTVSSVDERQTRYGTEYSVVFMYKVDGGYYAGTFTTSEAYRKDDTITVLYDPSNPDRNNLSERETIRHWVISAVVCVGGLVFLYFVLH